MPEKLDQHDIKDLCQRAKLKLKMSPSMITAYLGITLMTLWRWQHGKARPSALAMRQLHRLHKKVGGNNG